MNWLNFANSIPVPEIREIIYEFILVDNGDALIGLRPKIDLKAPKIKLASSEVEDSLTESSNSENEEIYYSSRESSSGSESTRSYNFEWEIANNSTTLITGPSPDDFPDDLSDRYKSRQQQEEEMAEIISKLSWVGACPTCFYRNVSLCK